ELLGGSTVSWRNGWAARMTHGAPEVANDATMTALSGSIVARPNRGLAGRLPDGGQDPTGIAATVASRSDALAFAPAPPRTPGRACPPRAPRGLLDRQDL